MSGYTRHAPRSACSRRPSAARSPRPPPGWNVGASYLVDVVTAASPDVVSTASRRFARHAPRRDGRPAATSPVASACRSTATTRASTTTSRARSARTVNGDFLDKQLTPAARLRAHAGTRSAAPAPTTTSSTNTLLDRGDLRRARRSSCRRSRSSSSAPRVALESGDQSKTVPLHPALRAAASSVPVGASADDGEPRAPAGEAARAAPARSAALLARRALHPRASQPRRRCASRSASTTTRGASRRARPTRAT